LIGDVAIVDTVDALRLEEGRLPPVLYVPLADVRADLLSPTDHSTYCGLKGDANYYSLRLSDGRVFENAVWQYSHPKAGLDQLSHRVAFYGHVIDRWVEDEEEAA
jgi:uncharacterized protein (DUF427 family)